jgi:NitT/TauT family transport system permease protein
MLIRRPIHAATRITLALAAFAVLLGTYAWLSYRAHQANPRNTTMPNARQIGEGCRKILATDKEAQSLPDRLVSLRESWLWEDSRATFGRLLGGLCVGVLLSVAVGMAMGCFVAAESFFELPISFFAKIPPTAMLAVYFVLFGTETRLFVAMIALGIFPTLAQAIYQAAKNDVPDNTIYKAYTLGASEMEIVWNVILRQILPRIIEAVRLQVGPAMVFLIAAEYVVADLGFGYRLRIQSRLLNMNVVYVYLVILGLSGFFFDWLLTALRRKLAPWFGD